MPQPAASIFVPIFAACITLIGTAATLFYAWWREHNSKAKRTRAFEDAKKELDFWDARLKLLGVTLSGRELDEAKVETTSAVERISARVQSAVSERVAFQAEQLKNRSARERVGYFRRIFLLYRTSSWWGLFFRFSIISLLLGGVGIELYRKGFTRLHDLGIYSGSTIFYMIEVDPIVWTKFRPFLDGVAV